MSCTLFRVPVAELAFACPCPIIVTPLSYFVTRFRFQLRKYATESSVISEERSALLSLRERCASVAIALLR